MSMSDVQIGNSYALLIAADRYQDPELSQLRSPARDAERLAATLSDPAIGGYQVNALANEQTYLVSEEIEGFFTDRRSQDKLVLYISCHGVKDLVGRLRFATINTRMNRLASTSIPADFIYEQVDRCRAGNILILLDCCYSGAYLKGHRPRSTDRAEIGVMQGKGRAVMTSCTSLEYSFEVNAEMTPKAPITSAFTAAIVEGLQTGKADVDGDGLVSLDDLYSYVFERVRRITPLQTPELKWGDVRGQFIVARNPFQPTDPAESLPAELLEAMSSRDVSTRTAAIEDLATLVRQSQKELAWEAHGTLMALAADDSKTVSAAAEAMLAEFASGNRNRMVRTGVPRRRTSQNELAPMQSTVGSNPRYPDWNPHISNTSWLFAVYLVPVVLGLVGSIFAGILIVKGDRLLRMNAIQSLTLQLGYFFYFLRITAFPAIADNITTLITVLLSAGLLSFCVLQVARRKQPRIIGLSKIAYWFAYNRGT